MKKWTLEEVIFIIASILVAATLCHARFILKRMSGTTSNSGWEHAEVDACVTNL